MHLSNCSCAPILRFFFVASDGATTERQISNRVFGQFRTSLRKDSVANYASIWTPFSTSATGPGVLCNALNVSQICLYVAPVAPQDSQNCARDFAKRKQSDAQFAGSSPLRMVIIVRVTNTLLGGLTLRSGRYCIVLHGMMLLFLVVIFVTLGGRRAVRSSVT